MSIYAPGLGEDVVALVKRWDLIGPDEVAALKIIDRLSGRRDSVITAALLSSMGRQRSRAAVAALRTVGMLAPVTETVAT